jgi:hypothetical protein
MAGENGDYSVGDPVIIQLDGFKSNVQNSFYQVSGTIKEPAASGIRHKVIGNLAATFEQIADLEQIYEARISAIGISPTGYYLINVRELEKISLLEEEVQQMKQVAAPAKELPKSNVIPFAGKTNDELAVKEFTTCECCSTMFESSEIKPYIHESQREDGGSLRRVLKTCEGCQTMIGADSSLFDRAYANKLEKLRSRGVALGKY